MLAQFNLSSGTKQLIRNNKEKRKHKSEDNAGYSATGVAEQNK